MISKSLKIATELKNKINELISSSNGSEVMNFYNKRFIVPSKILEQYFKYRISLYLNTKTLGYKKELSKWHAPLSLIYYYAYIFYVFIFSRRIKKIYDYELLVDDIQNQHDINIWLDLERQFSSNKTVFITKSNKIKCKHRNIIFRGNLRGYDLKYLSRNIFRMIFIDPIYLVWCSFKLDINFFQLHLHFLNDYLYYDSLFKVCSSRYLIQHRNLGRTNALKNYLFKRAGGICASCLQKNIAEHNGSALFYDIDIFFTYGDKTSDDISTLGARIDKVIPIGSLSMSNALSKSKDTVFKNNINNKNIDMLFIGQNTTSPNTDWTYNFESLKWLVKLKNEHPKLRIVIKHHATWKGEEQEQKITNGSGIEYIDKSVNSYLLGLESKIILTYGSSMGYEFLGLGMESYFLDPGEENPFINSFVYSDNIVINNYDDLKLLASKREKVSNNYREINKSNYCYPNSDISKRIYKILISYTSIIDKDM